MKRTQNFWRISVVASLALVAVCAQAMGVDLQAFALSHPELLLGAGLLGETSNFDAVLKGMETIENKLKAMSDKAEGEFKTIGKVSEDTKTALDSLGKEQRTLADRMLLLEQKGSGLAPDETKAQSWGEQVIKDAHFADFVRNPKGGFSVEVKNTLTGSDTNVAPDRKPGIVGGAFLPFSMEALLPSTPTSSNAIEFTRENVFTNSAAAASEGAAKGESSFTWTLVNMPISTVAHWIKISKQLAADAPALAAYVNTRMRYGVNQKVDTQLVVGDGTPPNISGTYKSGNYTAHGYANADLGSVLKKYVLIRKIMADLYIAGYPADAVVLNPADWAQMEIDAFTTAAGQMLMSLDSMGRPLIFGVPVVQSIGMAADTFQVGRFSEAYMVHNREGVVVDMSESDSDNFTKNLITLRAERRLALATERPAAVRGGDLTPA